MEKTFHIVTHTHWDREWHKTFEQFRMILVDLVDKLLDMLENDEQYTCFHLDGQTIVLDDYLEIRPENRERLERLIREQKLFIGPWYILPDEFLVSGEGIIRNLLKGNRAGEQFGHVMKVGYIPDSFGHLSQIPQIFNGFGIDNVVLWRGFGGEPGQEKSEYNWSSPDGSKALMIHLPEGGYARDYISSTDCEHITETMESIYDKLLSRATTPHLLMLQGSDHLWPYPEIPKIIEYLNSRYPHYHFILSSLEDYLAAVRDTAQNLPEITGEHRFGYRYAPLLQGVYSSRMNLKIANEKCQTTLEKFSEPLNALNVFHGNKSRTQFLDLAWKYVLQNHPHDSICGCSIDGVHRENMIRFEKAEQIAEEIIRYSMSEIVHTINNSDNDVINIFNPSPYLRSELVECSLDFPVGENPTQDIPQFSLINSDKNPVPYQILNITDALQLHYLRYDYLKQYPVKRIRILVNAKQLPPLGIASFQIARKATDLSVEPLLKTGRFFLENDSVRVDINPQGELKITDKIQNLTYDRMNVFEDCADIGDEYNYCPPENDTLFYSTDFEPRLSVIEQGPLRGAIRIRTRMKLPDAVSQDRKSRSTNSNILKLSSIVHLDYDSPVVYFETTVENTCQDHRLRVFFRTLVKSGESHAETVFHVITRQHKKPNPADYAIEIPSSTHPMQRFVTVADNEKGMTLFSKGLPEYEFMPDRQGTLALTLLRCVSKLSVDDIPTRPVGHAGPELETPEAQCQGNYRFRYAILPHSSDLEKEWETIHDYADWHNAKPPVIQSSFKNDIPSFFSIEPRILRLSAFKEAEDGNGLVIRVCNSSAQKVDGAIKFTHPLKKAFSINLNEDIERETVITDNNTISLAVDPWEIYSVRVQL